MKIPELHGKRILLTQTAHIGDIVISLPVAGVIKYYFPQCHIIFLASGAGASIAKLHSDVDEVHDWNTISQLQAADRIDALRALRADIVIHLNPRRYINNLTKKAGIPIRIGSLYRWYNWFNCNRLVPISRRHSQYNKRQLDLQYLIPLGIKHDFSYQDLQHLYRFKALTLKPEHQKLLHEHRFKLILHPLLITAKNYQWPLEYFARLIELLPSDRYQIFISGTINDREILQPLLLKQFSHVVDLVGILKVDEFLAFMQQCQGLIAGSTGPVHMAAAVGIHALAISHPNATYIKRWEPVGHKAEVIAAAKACKSCPNSNPCSCICAIVPELVMERVEHWYQRRYESPP